MLAKNSSNPSLSWALRIQGEVHFAQGNYLAAMQHYIKSVIVSTQFFQRPWSPMQSITGMWSIHGKKISLVFYSEFFYVLARGEAVFRFIKRKKARFLL